MAKTLTKTRELADVPKGDGMTLSEAYKLFGTCAGHPYTDKGPPSHSYLAWYEQRLAPYQHTVENLIEFGVEKEYRSLQLWRAYFSRAHIWGMDIRPVQFTEDRITFIEGNCTIGVPPNLPQFDIIIDDASHHYNDQVAAYAKWWAMLKPGGLYVIEDVADSICITWFKSHGFEYHPFLKDGRADDRLLCCRKT